MPPQEMLTSIRYQILPFVICLMCANFGWAQTSSHTQALVLPKGSQTTSYRIAIPLAQGQYAALASFSVSDVSNTIEIQGEAFAKTYYAARQPVFTVEFEVSSTRAAQQEIPFQVDLSYQLTSPPLQARSGPTEPPTSVLASGRFMKLSVTENGLYKIDKALLDELGFGSATPQNVRLYAKGGAMLPQAVSADYPVDLQEVALFEVGNGDASWAGGESLLFYGEAEDVWTWDESKSDFTRIENIYSEETYYYITAGGSGKRMQQIPSVAASYSPTFTARAHWEEDLQNLLYFSQQKYGSGQGSGQDWFGELLGTNRTIQRPGIFQLGDIPANGSGRLRSRLAANSLNSGTRYTVDLNGETFRSSPIPDGVRSNANRNFAAYGLIDTDLQLRDGSVDVVVRYPGSLETNPGWLDYVEITHDALMIFNGSPLHVQSNKHLSSGAFGFSASGMTANTSIIDISNRLSPKLVTTTTAGASTNFGYQLAANETPHEFLIFDRTAAYAAPTIIGEVAKSNLHGLKRSDVVIIYGEGLEQAAEKLAAHRRSFSGYASTIVQASTIYEEFGAGRADPGAIRAFVRMLHERDPNFRYLTLLGDAHFDFRNIIRQEPNLVPVYQTDRSDHEIYAFPTDDYYALLNDGEGVEASSVYPKGQLDVAIGRIPVTTLAQANGIIDKIIRYDSDIDLQGEWRLRTVYVADDEDNNLHVRDMDIVAETNASAFPDFNQVKVYVDAYEQVPTPGGKRIPRAAEAINQNMFRGNLVTTYLGHGGPRGWGQERFLNAPDIEKWNARNALPVMVTATCTFTGFDDPTLIVAGESVLIKPDGGSVATLSTVRPVFTTANFQLTREAHKQILDDSLSSVNGIGLQVMMAKNNTTDNSNDRKFMLFGDPAMRLAVPILDVVLTNFDSIDVRTQPDTIAVPALKEFSISGVVQSRTGGIVTDFNGEVSITIFDQNTMARTLGQDPTSSVKEFDQQGNVLFTGRASVIAGRWTAKFMLPKDLSVSRGLGRISLYASSPDGRDGAGRFNRFFVDGRATPGINDDEPPVVEVYLGSEEFVAGGITSEDPVLVARISDNTGINVSGASIGHDLTASLRGVTEDNYVLNDFYQADKDDYSRGLVRYPVFDLPEGEYELEVRAWDLANNTGTGTTTFVVSDDAGIALDRVLNYPNPFVDATCFQFEHTAAGQYVEVQVDVYTTSGRLVRSIRHEGVAQGFRFGNDDCISWDGTDEYGQALARGVYLYKVALRTQDEKRSGESDFERLVVLK